MRFLHGWDGPVRTQIEAMVAEFGSIYPGVEIESEAVEPAALHDALVTALASGSPPNAVMLRSDSAPYFADARTLLPLDPLLDRDSVQRGWFKPRELAARTWDNQLYGLPHVAVGAEHLLYVNLALLERLGHDPGAPITTWAKLQALTEPARRMGALALDPTRCGGGVLGLRVWTYAAGGRWLDDGGRTVTWAEPPVVEAAEWMQQMVAAQRGEASLPEIANAGAGPLSVQEWVQQRHICCVQDAGWRARLIQEAPQLRFGLVELPGPEGVPADRRRTPSFGGWMLAIPREGRDQAAAWEWLKYVSIGEGAEQLAGALGRPSPLARSPVSASSERAPVSRVVLDAQARSVVVPAMPIAARLDDLARDAQARLLSQRHAPKSLLEAAAQEAQQLLDAWHARRRRS